MSWWLAWGWPPPTFSGRLIVHGADVLRGICTLIVISSLATVGGAIGSGMEDEDTVRAAAYGYHPEPGGWQDEKDG